MSDNLTATQGADFSALITWDASSKPMHVSSFATLERFPFSANIPAQIKEGSDGCYDIALFSESSQTGSWPEGALNLLVSVIDSNTNNIVFKKSLVVHVMSGGFVGNINQLVVAQINDTYDQTVRIVGEGVIGQVVTVADNGEVLGTCSVNSDGLWEIQTSSMSDGVHKISATSTASNGVIISSNTVAFTLDSSTPKDTEITNVVLTNNATTLSVYGTASQNSDVLVTFGGGNSRNTISNNQGLWVLTYPPKTQYGTYPIIATPLNPVGKPGKSYQYDYVLSPPLGAPNSPVINSPRGAIADRRPTVSGSSDPNVIIKISDQYGIAATVQSNAVGYWEFEYKNELPDGDYWLSAYASNEVGSSYDSGTVDFKIVASSIDLD